MNASERETVINLCDDLDHVMIWTAQRRHITALRKKAPTVTEVRSFMVDGTECVEFTVPVDMYDPARGVRHKLNLTDDERKARAARLRPLHAA